MLRNSTTRDTSRAVIMAMPRSSLNFLIIVYVPPLVGWKRGTHVARISVLRVPPRDRRLDLDVRAAVRVLVDQERHDDGPSPLVGVGVEREGGRGGWSRGRRLVDDAVGDEPPTRHDPVGLPRGGPAPPLQLSANDPPLDAAVARVSGHGVGLRV